MKSVNFYCIENNSECVIDRIYKYELIYSTMKREEIYSTVIKYFEGKPVKKIYILGSYALGKERDNSDLDILIELKRPVGLMELSRYKNDLQDQLGLNVDLGTELGLSVDAINKVQEESRIVYEA